MTTPPLHVVPHAPAPPQSATVLCVCSTGTNLEIPRQKTSDDYHDFVYAGRLWALNQAMSHAMQRDVFCEINDWVVQDMRQQSFAVLTMADRFAAQLELLKEHPPTQQ